MTPEQHAQRIRWLEIELYKATYGMGMPYDHQRVVALREQIEEEKAVLHLKVRGEANDNARNDGYDITEVQS